MTAKKRKTSKPQVIRDKVVIVRANGLDFRVYVPDRKQSKTVWLHIGDVGSFMKIVAQHVQEHIPKDLPLGLMWLDGKSQWVARWLEDGGASREVAVTVLRHKTVNGEKVMLVPSVFNSKMVIARATCRAKAEQMGMPVSRRPGEE